MIDVNAANESTRRPIPAESCTDLGADESGPMYRLTWRDRFGMAIPLLCVAVAVALMAAAARLS